MGWGELISNNSFPLKARQFNYRSIDNGRWGLICFATHNQDFIVEIVLSSTEYVSLALCAFKNFGVVCLG